MWQRFPAGILIAALAFAAGALADDGLAPAVDDKALLADWARQDGLYRGRKVNVEAVSRPLAELGDAAGKLRTEYELLKATGVGASDPRWKALYVRACERRRRRRLARWLPQLRRVVFTKHYDLGGSHYAYTEGQSDAQRERHFRPGAALCVLRMEGTRGVVRTLLADADGVIRDPDVSYDGRRILFSWKKADRKDDYHLYEMDADGGPPRQLTEGLGFADYEGAYLPNGHIVFNSTRCVQTVDCWWTEVSNLFTCDGSGRFLRRLSYDQVHTNYPTVTPDGRVIYTRWDYNDRGQIYPQGLFQMNPDGTMQTELYGNNSWFPTTILHTRAVPGTGKYVCIFTGHHTRQKGWLGLLDPMKGRQENQGAQLIAPVRDTPAVHVDRYGQKGDQFQYPYPLTDPETGAGSLDAFLVTMAPEGVGGRFALYLVYADGRRELLARDGKNSCNQPVPLAPRPVPHPRPNVVNYRQREGVVYLQDIHVGEGLAGIERGTVERLRVVALEFRAAGVGSNGNRGPAGGALVSTPISIQGSWDVKVVLGSTPVYADGSACFKVPAKTPLYFQALDANNHAVQTMRSWVTLQPGEAVACVGCHEDKNTTPPVLAATRAMASPPRDLDPFYGPPRGFSFHREIQPILDRHCIRCHHKGGRAPAAGSDAGGRAFDPKTMTVLVPTKADGWRYTLDEPPGREWRKSGYDDSGWKPGRAGFGRKGTPGATVRTPWGTKAIWLRKEFTLGEDVSLRRPALLIHHDEGAEVYVNGVQVAKVTGYTTDYVIADLADKATRALRPGRNLLAVKCWQTRGGQYIDVGIVETARPGAAPEAAKPAKPDAPPDVKPAFSLKGAPGEWSPAYRALADRRVCSWISPQSVPSMLPPYHAGAARSKLIAMLRDGHNGVRLTTEEMDKLACWIDLLVPCFGSYTERAMSEKDRAKYEHFLRKRRDWQAVERENIAAWLERLGDDAGGHGGTAAPADR